MFSRMSCGSLQSYQTYHEPWVRWTLKALLSLNFISGYQIKRTAACYSLKWYSGNFGVQVCGFIPKKHCEPCLNIIKVVHSISWLCLLLFCKLYGWEIHSIYYSDTSYSIIHHTLYLSQRFMCPSVLSSSFPYTSLLHLSLHRNKSVSKHNGALQEGGASL